MSFSYQNLIDSAGQWQAGSSHKAWYLYLEVQGPNLDWDMDWLHDALDSYPQVLLDKFLGSTLQ